jgi:hypothetical protein
MQRTGPVDKDTVKERSNSNLIVADCFLSLRAFSPTVVPLPSKLATTLLPPRLTTFGHIHLYLYRIISPIVNSFPWVHTGISRRPESGSPQFVPDEVGSCCMGRHPIPSDGHSTSPGYPAVYAGQCHPSVASQSLSRRGLCVSS